LARLIVLDASVLIAHLASDDAHHSAATRVLEAHVDEEFVVHPVNLAEILVGPARVQRVKPALEALEAIAVEEWIAAPGEAVRLAQLRVNTGLKMPDCCALCAAIDSGSTLATFDVRLAEVARGLGVVVVSAV
jgi:predicted nucleic acid-binding protein